MNKLKWTNCRDYISATCQTIFSMKPITTILLLLSWASCFSQGTEFGKSANGLIYPDSTIRQLKFIVDSLNLKFRVCELNKTYLSEFQARANFISLDSGDIKQARKDLESNISFEDFSRKYGKLKLDKELL